MYYIWTTWAFFFLNKRCTVSWGNMQCVFMRLPAAVQASQVLQDQTGGTTASVELWAPGHCSV